MSYATAKKMYVAVAILVVVIAVAPSVKPPDDAYTPLLPVTSAAVLLSNKYGLEPLVNPRAESYVYQSPVESVLLIKTNLAPPEPKPHAIACPVPLPV